MEACYMRSLRKPYLPFFVILAVAVIFTGVCFGQIKSGTITGTVTDPTGAGVPEANVTVINQETNVPTTTVADKSGTFTVPCLHTGTHAGNGEQTGSGVAQ